MRTGALLAIGLVLCANPQCCFPQSDSAGLRTWVEDRGSVPPVNPWFVCINELEHKPYDKHRAQECLDSLLSHPEIEKAQISFRRHKQENLLTFHLQSPKLIVSDMEFGVADGDLAKIHELLAANGNALRLGEPYERRREGASWLVLDLFLRSQGRRAGVSRTLHLDYDKKTAQVAYKIWDGPLGEPERLVPPYAEPCPIINANFNGFDWDDLTPVRYIQQQMKTKWMGCFSEYDFREDEDLLGKIPFLKESKISVSGSGGSRNFAFHFRSNPIPIVKVRVQGYGLFAGLSQPDIPTIAIHVGDTFSTSRLNEQAASLKKAYEQADRQLKVFTDVRISAKGEATLDFSLVAYPDDTIYIGGKAYDVTSKWDGPYVPD